MKSKYFLILLLGESKGLYMYICTYMPTIAQMPTGDFLAQSCNLRFLFNRLYMTFMASMLLV
jgi:hypothetical protein